MEAHPQHAALGDRYVKLVVGAAGLRLVYNLAYSPAGSLVIKRDMDVDRDDQVSPDEARRGARAIGARIARAAGLLVNDDPVAIRWTEPFVAPASGPVDPTPLTIELTAEVQLDPGESRVVLADVPLLDGIDRTDVRFVAEPPAELRASGSGRAPSGTEQLVSWLDRREPGAHPVALRVWLPGSTARTLWVATAAAVGLAVVVVLGLFGWVRRRRASARRTGR